MVSYGAGASSGEWLYGWPMMHNMSGLNMALQWHLWVPHVHNSSHVGIVFSCIITLCLYAFISV